MKFYNAVQTKMAAGSFVSFFRSVSCRLVCLAAVISLSLTPRAALAQWEITGPYGGGADLIRVVPQTPDYIIAATHNGYLFTSANGGAAWSHLPFPGQSSGTLHAIEVDPRYPGTFYVGMDSEHSWLSGVYKTTDAGKTWSLLPGTKGKAIWSITLWSGDPNLVIAGAGDGVYRSKDAGDNWEHISPDGDPELRPVVSLEIDPDNRDIIYAGTTHLPWRTSNGGSSWESIHEGMIDDSDVFSIQVESHNHQLVYASACSGLYQSPDGAAHWTKLQTPIGAFRTWFVSLDPAHAGTVFAGTSAGLMRSENAGHTWVKVTAQPIRSMVFDSKVPGRIFLASATAGLMVSTDNGRTLKEINNGFTNRNFSVLTGSKGVLYASSMFEPAFGGLYRSDDLGLKWQRPGAGRAPSTQAAAGRGGVARVAAPTDTRVLTAAPDRSESLVAATYRGLIKSEDGGKTWSERKSPPDNTGVTSVTLLANNVLLAGTHQGLYRSVKGAAWAPAAGVTGGVSALQRSGADAVAAIGEKGAFVSMDGGNNFTVCGALPTPTVWYGLAFDTASSGTPVALAATAAGLFRSTDGCQTWARPSASLQETASVVLFHPTHPGQAFAAQGGKVLRSDDGGEQWQALSDGGQGRSWPSELVVLPDAPERLFVLLPRRGVLSHGIETQTGSAPVSHELAVQSSK